MINIDDFETKNARNSSRLVAACLRSLATGAEIQDLRYLQAWMRRADELSCKLGSDEQLKDLTRFKGLIEALANFEAKHGIGSALNVSHPILQSRYRRLGPRIQSIMETQGFSQLSPGSMAPILVAPH
jgi:hypothetical protein